jgi:hypothetical protein
LIQKFPFCSFSAANVVTNQPTKNPKTRPEKVDDSAIQMPELNPLLQQQQQQQQDDVEPSNTAPLLGLPP